MKTSSAVLRLVTVCHIEIYRQIRTQQRAFEKFRKGRDDVMYMHTAEGTAFVTACFIFPGQ
jgi:hypothetical protein